MGRRLVVPKRIPPIKPTWIAEGGRPPQPGEGCWVGIDPSLTGLGAVALGSKSYFWRLHKPKCKAGERLAVHRHLLTDFFDYIPEPDKILIEGPGWESQKVFSAGVISGLIVAVLYDLGYEDKVHYKPIAPPTLKKFVSGKGNCDKRQIISSVRKHWGVTIDDHNVADAYGIAQAAMSLSTGQALYAWQADALRGLGSPDDATVDD